MSRRLRRRSLFLTSTMLLCVAGLAAGQVTPGTPSFTAYDSHEVDTVNLMNNNILLTVPVMSKAGAFGFNHSLSTSSYMFVQGSPSTWSANMGIPPLGTSGSPFYGSVNGLIGPGGSIWSVFYTTLTETTCNGSAQYVTSGYYTYSSNGTRHYFPASDTTKSGTGSGCTTGFTDTTIDGSGITATIYGGSVTSMYLRNGTSVNFSTITDSNGNSITASGTGTSFTDSLGLTALTTSGSGVPLQYKWTDVNGGSPTLSQLTSPLILKSVFSCSGTNDYDGGTTTTALTSGFSFPDGTSLGFTYETTPGFSPKVTGRLNQITLREGGTIAYTYGGGTHNGLDCTYQNAPTLTRTLGNGDVTTYTLTHPQIGTSGNYQAVNTVIDPGGNKTIYTFTGFTSTGLAALPTAQLLTQVQRYQGSSTLLTTDVYCYNTNTSNCATAVASYPITEVDVYHTIYGMSNSSRTQTKYDAYQNVTYSAQYDFGGTTAVRATTIRYGSCSAGCTGSSPTISAVGSNVNDKPGDVSTTQNGSNVAESRYTYDSHGNLLTTYAWNGSSWLSNPTANVYNSNGTISTVYDLGGNPTTYGYSSASYTSCGSCTNFPFATSVTKGGLTTYSTWNGVGSVKLTDKDANGNTTTYGYVNALGTADPYWRVMSVTDPLSNEVWKTYPTGSSPDTINSSFTFNSSNSIQNTTKTVDVYGRTSNVQTQQSPLATNYDTASPVYGWSTNYRTVASSLPCATTSGSTCPTTHTNYYDPLGRLYQGATVSNETVTHTYTQNDDLVVLSPAPGNENNKQVQKEYDGLGRLTKSCAIGNGSSTACGQHTGSANGLTTSFSYASATGSTTTTTTRGSQTRTNTYDALGRLTQKITPEGGTWIYTYDNDSNCIAGYRGVSGQLASVSFPTGNFCYKYDALNRVIGVAASNGTACRHFYYDNSTGYSGTIPTGISISNPYGRMVEAATDSCSSGTLKTDLWFSYDKDGHVLDQWESTPNSNQYYHSIATFYGNGAVNSVQLASPSFYTQTYGLDGEGRWNSLTTSTTATPMVSSTTYNAAGQATNIYIGSTSNTDQDDYTYDSNTGRMKTWTFKVNSMTDVGTLTWNANGTLNNLAIVDGFNSGGSQTCYFNPSSGTGMGYDDWGRLLNDDCGSGGWGQTFSYDQYNNLTKAVISGRTGITFNPGYSSSNNQYASGFGASYDSNGNLTNDTFHVYEWNEFSKMKSVDRTGTNCVTSGQCIVYDALGRMVEIDSASTNTEIWYTQGGAKVFMSRALLNYAYWPAPGGGTVLDNGNGGSIYYEHKDWLGSARVSSSVMGRAIIDDRAFAPYGEIYGNFGSTARNENIFGGGMIEGVVTGTFDAENREYNGAAQGRWISPDPAGFGWNQYGYSTNPNSAIDPSGLGESDHCGRWCYSTPDARSGTPTYNPSFGLFNAQIPFFESGGWGLTIVGATGGTVGADSGSQPIGPTLPSGAFNTADATQSDLAWLAGPDAADGWAVPGAPNLLADTNRYAAGVSYFNKVADMVSIYALLLGLDDGPPVPDEGTTPLYHASVDNYSEIMANGLDASRGTTYVTDDLNVAIDTIMNHSSVTLGVTDGSNAGIITSNIPNSTFFTNFDPFSRPYGGWSGSNLNSSEIPMTQQLQFDIFNSNIVKKGP
jgi:RHS repeat-associated protein